MTSMCRTNERTPRKPNEARSPHPRMKLRGTATRSGHSGPGLEPGYFLASWGQRGRLQAPGPAQPRPCGGDREARGTAAAPPRPGAPHPAADSPRRPHSRLRAAAAAAAVHGDSSQEAGTSGVKRRFRRR